ncbi:hypothetical protein GCK72_022369 [Caenorhabditis remanei]|uniref:Uncharacterized protein n=1 Tax=Caenorhabditis remanei TaxID=31234 RepID=A0A6A5FTM5_CAERE|nr:hypothetical protein GCK72_022369 [Caenorhabditis remanei]KAF1745922.1 hypothetical protein GCK72_022369 [Caenorhabditis remanei]
MAYLTSSYLSIMTKRVEEAPVVLKFIRRCTTRQIVNSRPPYTGFKSNIAAVGGSTANEIQAMKTLVKPMNQEFLGSDENTIREKVFR